MALGWNAFPVLDEIFSFNPPSSYCLKQTSCRASYGNEFKLYKNS